MKHQRKISCSDLLKLLPENLFEQLTASTRVDYQVKKLNGRNIFNLMLMTTLDSERLSLRVMETMYESERFKVFAGLAVNDKTKHTSLSDRLATINSDYFEQIFIETSKLISKRFAPKELKRYTLERVDSTVISLSSKLLNIGMQSGKKNQQGEHGIKQLKFTIGFNGLAANHAKLYSQQKYLSEDHALKESILSQRHSKNSIVVFDRGLKARKTYAAFDKQGIHFVTRINPTKNYKTLKVLSTEKVYTDTICIKEEKQIYLLDGDGKQVKTPLRLLIAESLETKEPIYFITNIVDLSAIEIAYFYQLRWDIEVFFKFLKQELNLKHLVSRNENGIKVMLYMSLIAAMLLMLYKKLNNIEGYKIAKIKFINELDMEIVKVIIELCNGKPEKLKSITHFKGFGH